MKIVVDINHPAHVHFFKNFIWKIGEKGHDVMITASEKDVAMQLMEYYGFKYVNLGSYGTSLINKVINIPVLDYRMYKEVKRLNPDIFMGVGSIRAAHVSQLLRKPCINFEDSEHAAEQHILFTPFTDAIFTSLSYKKEISKKQIRYNGYHELTYLHPNYFKPNPAVLNEIGLNEFDNFVILRFVSWNASHDVGHRGIGDKIGLIQELEKYGHVFITSEGTLEKALQKYQLQISPDKMHDMLYYASLYIGEGGTMASEAAVLGTHAILISTLAKYCGVFYDQSKYDLLWFFDDEKAAWHKAINLLKTTNLRELGKEKRKRLINDKIDVTKLIIWLIENYPGSLKIIKENPEIEKFFKEIICGVRVK